MGLITKIRKNGSWIMVILIGLGLGGFILMDMMVGQTSVFGSSQPVLGKINGEKINIQEFNTIEAVLGSAADPLSRRASLWNFMVEEILMKKEAEATGLSVSSAELTDLQYGAEPSAIIQQRFFDQNTMQLDREQLNQIRQLIESNTADPQLRAFWKFQEREIIKDRLQGKLRTMVEKAIYTPTWMAEQINKDQTQLFNIRYVRVPYDVLDDSEVALEDADFEAYIKENANTLKTKEERRRIAYVSFDVKPSAADSAALRQSLQELYVEFDTTSNDSVFIQQNLGVMDKAYISKEQLPVFLADTLMSLPLGTVYGPYQDGNAYRMVKIIDRKMIPDSVRSRHILIPAQDAQSLQVAQARIDSLKQVIEEGKGTFADLAAKFGTDATASKGGDLDFAAPGMMVKPFNDLIFFEAAPGKLYSVITQFGVHLVEVTDRKFTNNNTGIRLAILTRGIFPSEDTRQAAYDDILLFLSKARTMEALKKEAAAKGLEVVSAPLVTANDAALGALGSSQQSRDIIKWAFGAKQGNVSSNVYIYSDPVENYDNRYVAAGLERIQKKGLPSAKDVRSEIEPFVIKRKKGEMISKQLSGKTLEAAAKLYDVDVDSLSNINFATSFMPEIGNEPKLLGHLARLEAGKTSPAIVGSNGVYMVSVLQKTASQPLANLAELRRTMNQATRPQASITLMEGIKKNAKIDDRRNRFF